MLVKSRGSKVVSADTFSRHAFGDSCICNLADVCPEPGDAGHEDDYCVWRTGAILGHQGPAFATLSGGWVEIAKQCDNYNP
jgi:hypothetical protein